MTTDTRTLTKGMTRIDGDTFWMGSEDFYPEERPVHQVGVDGFWIDTHQVTVAQFRRFVKDTGHVSTAETAPDPADYPGADPALLVPGSLVFTPPPGRVPLDDYTRWWSFVPGADWRHPEGPDSNVGGREHHPVTQVSYSDALAYARWAGKDLATEAEWEFAARGGLDRKAYVWGDHDSPPGKRPLANVWQGEFPWQNLALDGYEGTAPVGKFPPNGYGLYDMAGNVWEWTSDFHTGDHSTSGKNIAPAHSCCIPRNPRVTTASVVEGEPRPRRVIKGGSHLCAPNYCLRYRPAARQGETEETSTCHIGFRCVVRDRS
ncbi:formylglycine-generating enzyme family protein [Rhodococcus sp. D2-41]|uniref:Formylglycine-generating enzyme family protein n=2 Tax=Speluncibacter jeojiensis TaxID=2710754 RepID=A0A9X4M511_9ACTN|nr:formylglycine-generating enzyme family protein [Rhodococcus sp. D2-41]MDG3009435.1 formylglycine-generating enzyme family protein [Rhodococcus sp. D2-41]MDG3016937.1 formylglycine-generating enzyme family protein [Corynebacteriales bacterium D3-21]